MRLRHIAALTLASWYLLVPMFDPKSGKMVPLPMAEWNEEGIFESEKDCLVAKRALADDYKRHGANAKVQNVINTQASCVLSDDPKIQGKTPYGLGPAPPPR